MRIGKITLIIITMFFVVGCSNDEPKLCTNSLENGISIDGELYKISCIEKETLYYALINNEFKVVIPAMFSSIDKGTKIFEDQEVEYYFDETIKYFRVSIIDTEGLLKFGVINREGKYILDVRYNKIYINHESGLIYFEDENNSYLYNISLDSTSELEFTIVNQINNRWIAQSDSKQFIYTADFILTNYTGYENIIDVDDELIIYEENNTYTVYDYLNDNVITSFYSLESYKKLGIYENNLLFYVNNNKIVLYNYLNNESLIVDEYDFKGMSDKYIYYRNGKLLKVFDLDFNLVYLEYEILDYFDNNILLLKQENNYFLANETTIIELDILANEITTNETFITKNKYISVYDGETYSIYSKDLYKVIDSQEKCIIDDFSNSISGPIVLKKDCLFNDYNYSDEFVYLNFSELSNEYYAIFETTPNIIILASLNEIVFLNYDGEIVFQYNELD